MKSNGYILSIAQHSPKHDASIYHSHLFNKFGVLFCKYILAGSNQGKLYDMIELKKRERTRQSPETTDWRMTRERNPAAGFIDIDILYATTDQNEKFKVRPVCSLGFYVRAAVSVIVNIYIDIPRVLIKPSYIQRST